MSIIIENLINPMNDEVKTKIIKNITIYYNNNISRCNKEINDFIIKANDNDLNIDEIFYKNLLLKTFAEIIFNDLKNNYEKVFNITELHYDFNKHIFFNIINNNSYNTNDELNNYYNEKFYELQQIITKNLTSIIQPDFNYCFIKFLNCKNDDDLIFINNKITSLNKYLNNTNDKFDNTYKYLNGIIDRLENRISVIERNYKQLIATRIIKIDNDYKKLNKKFTAILIIVNIIVVSNCLYYMYKQ